MKKISIVIIIALVALSFSGCAGTYLEKASKDLDKYVIQASYDDQNQVLSVVETFRYTNRTENTFDKLAFHIFANAYRQDAVSPIVSHNQKVKAYVNGYSYGDIEFDRVSVGGSDAAYSITGSNSDILEVPLGKTLYPSESVSVEMVFEIKLANIWHRLGYGENTVNLGNWFPILCYISNGEFFTDSYSPNGDPYVSDVANFEVGLTAPKGYVVGATGEQVEKIETGDDQKLTYTALAVRDFALVMSKNFNTEQRQSGGVELNYLYFADAEPAESADLAKNAFTYFEKILGAYPYDTLTVAETDFCYGGMEYPRLVMIGSGQEKEDFQRSIVHEIAHQWIYGIVGNDQYRNAWMDEGLAEFVTLMFFDEYTEYGIKMSSDIASRIHAYTQYVDVLKSYIQNFDTAMQKPLNNFVSEQDYVYATYVKGCLMFHDLYKTMGASKFKTALKKYVDNCKLAVATPEEMIGVFSEVYGADLTDWFTAYLTGKDVLSNLE